MAGDDRLIGLGRVYAEALFRLAEERGAAEELLAELEALAGVFATQPHLAEPLLSPIGDPAARRAALEHIFRHRTSDLLVDTLQVLNRRGRLQLFAAIAAAYREVFQQARHVLDVHVESAVPLDGAQRDRLRELTRRLTGHEARLLERVEPELLGGLVVRVRDRKFDTTLRRKLGRLHLQLTERASREIIQARGPAA